MRTLKRTLCLVLAMTMVLGFFGIASAKNASDYPDYDDVQYKEALGVMTGIEVIDGMGGEINPTGKVTRAQAAKMVTYAILGADVAKDLPVTASSFDDVNSYYDWAIPSIEYLADKGIVGGRSGIGGHYDPEGEVTAYEFAKMMLCAAGYGENDEYKGDSWALNVAIDARRNGVFTSTKAGNLNEPATREECALYCFNGLTDVCTVEYSKDTESYVKNQEKDENDKNVDITIAKNVYPTLKHDKVGTDDYGRPAVTWEYNNDKISALTATPVLTYTKSFVPAEAYKTLKDDGYKFEDEYTLVCNGKDLGTNSSNSFANNTKDFQSLSNGDVTEFYVNSKGAVDKIVVFRNYFYLVKTITEDNSNTAIDERSITFFKDIKTGNTVTATPKAEGFDNVYTVVKTLQDAGKNAGALVIPNFDTDSELPIISVSIPTFEELEVASVKSDANGNLISFVADGETYKFSAMSQIDSLNAGDTYTVYFDAYGYAIYADTVDEVLNVGVVVDTGKMSDGFDEVAQVKLLGTDGEVTVLPVLAEKAEDIKDLENDIVSYKALSGANEGLYELTQKESLTAGVAITNGKVDFGDDYKADENTIFLVETLDSVTNKPSYTAYTGIKAVPSITECEGVTVYTDAKTTNECADVVFVKNATIELAATDGITFIAVDDKPITTDDDVVFDAALITGPDMTDIKPVQVTAEVAAQLNIKADKTPLVSAYTEEDGVIVAVTSYDEADATNKPANGFGVKAAKNGVVTLSGTTHTYADDCMVWVIDPSKTNSAEMFKDEKATTITDDDNDAVFWIENKISGEVSAIYIIKTSALDIAQMEAEKAPVVLDTATMDTQIDNVDVNTEKAPHIVVTVGDEAVLGKQNVGKGGNPDTMYVGVKVVAPVDGKLVKTTLDGGTDDVADGYGSDSSKGFVKVYLPIAEKNAEGTFEKATKDNTKMTFTFVYENGVEVTKTISYEVQ